MTAHACKVLDPNGCYRCDLNVDEMYYGTAYVVDCPTCGAVRGFRCRTIKTGKITDAHTARYVRRAHATDG